MTDFVTDSEVRLIGRPVIEIDGVLDFLSNHGKHWPELQNKLDSNMDLGDRDAEWIAEMAARGCYMSYPNTGEEAKGRSHEDHIKHLIEVGHFSTIEHAQFNFVVWNVSRSLTHELVRHRHANYSQISQRFVDSSDVSFVVPDGIQDLSNLHPELLDEWKESCLKSRELYQKLTDTLSETYKDIESKTEQRKKARQAARSVLPNATETKIFMSMNGRALRHFISMRAHPAADLEIRKLAVKIFDIMEKEFPLIVHGMELVSLPDGTQGVENKFREV